MLPGQRHRGSLPCGRYLLAPLNGNKEGSKCLMVLRVKHTPTRLPTNSLYTPMNSTPLHSISSVCHPWGLLLLLELLFRHQKIEWQEGFRQKKLLAFHSPGMVISVSFEWTKFTEFHDQFRGVLQFSFDWLNANEGWKQWHVKIAPSCR